MSSTATAPSAATPILCRGADIGYKAFARKLTPHAEMAVLILVANCYFGSSGYNIFFQGSTDGFQLMEQPPAGIVHELVTYCTASWASPGLIAIPKHVMITDAAGQHQIPVTVW